MRNLLCKQAGIHANFQAEASGECMTHFLCQSRTGLTNRLTGVSDLQRVAASLLSRQRFIVDVAVVLTAHTLLAL